MKLGPRHPAVGGFKDAIAGIIQIEGIRQHTVRGNRSRVEVIGEVKTAPAGDAGKLMGFQVCAAVERIIRLISIAGAQIMFVGVLAAIVPPMYLYRRQV